MEKIYPIRSSHEVLTFFNNLFMKDIPKDIQYWICGGAIRDFTLYEPIKDIDIWVRSKLEFDLLDSWFKTHPGYQQPPTEDNKLKYENSMWVKYVINFDSYGQQTIQLIKPVEQLNYISQVLCNFDFSCNTIALCSTTLNFIFWWDNQFFPINWHTGGESSWSNLLRQKICKANLQGRYLSSTVIRIPKMIKKGFFISPQNLNALTLTIAHNPSRAECIIDFYEKINFLDF